MNLIAKVKRLVSKPKVQRITFTWVTDNEGKVQSHIKFDKDIPVGYAATSLDRLKTAISGGMALRVTEAGYGPKNPKRRAFISKQTLGDILK